jgi:hypothetical protein
MAVRLRAVSIYSLRAAPRLGPARKRLYRWCGPPPAPAPVQPPPRLPARSAGRTQANNYAKFKLLFSARSEQLGPISAGLIRNPVP